MRLIFDARPIAQQYTGLGRYTGSLLRSLLKTRSNSRFRVEVLLHTGVAWDVNFHFRSLLPFIESGQLKVHFISAPPISVRQHLVVSSWINRRGADQYFYPHFDLPLGVRVPSIFVVHDLIPLIVSDYVQRFAWAKRTYFKQMVRRGVLRASKCFTVSKTTRQDVLNLVGQEFAHKVDYTYEGPVLDVVDRPAEVRASMGCYEPYLLYVGDRRPHKNIKRVIDIYSLLCNRYGYRGRLILVGSKNNFGFDVEAYVADQSDVDILGNVTDAQLFALYAGTDALLFLSEYEGFGLPVVEAAHLNKKIILSDGGALVEIAPPSACIVRRAANLDEAAAQASNYLASSIEVNNASYNKVFSWESAVRKIFPAAYC